MESEFLASKEAAMALVDIIDNIVLISGVSLILIVWATIWYSPTGYWLKTNISWYYRKLILKIK